MKLKRALKWKGKTKLLETECQLYFHRGVLFAVAEIHEGCWQSFCAFTGALIGAGTHPTEQGIIHCAKAVIQYYTPEVIERARNKLEAINQLTPEQIAQAKTL
jgi:hypothetical protein